MTRKIQPNLVEHFGPFNPAASPRYDARLELPGHLTDSWLAGADAVQDQPLGEEHQDWSQFVELDGQSDFGAAGWQDEV